MLFIQKSFYKICASGLFFTLGACSPQGYLLNPLSLQNATPSAQLDTKQSLESSSALLNETRAAETSKYYVPSITAIGFSSIAIQPSKSLNQRRLMAIRAAKLDAYRNLTEQLHGIYIQGETTIGEAVLTSDKLGAALRGTIIGARTVKIEPTGSDTYAGKTATVVGWGSIKEQGPQPDILREVTVRIWDNPTCKDTYGNAAPGGIMDHMLCAGQKGKDSCSVS